MKIDIDLAADAAAVLRSYGDRLCESDREMLSNTVKDFAFDCELSESLYQQRFGEIKALHGALSPSPLQADLDSLASTTEVVEEDIIE